MKIFSQTMYHYHDLRIRSQISIKYYYCYQRTFCTFMEFGIILIGNGTTYWVLESNSKRSTCVLHIRQVKYVVVDQHNLSISLLLSLNPNYHCNVIACVLPFPNHLHHGYSYPIRPLRDRTSLLVAGVTSVGAEVRHQFQG